jgi:acetyl-CoA carboxylase biotin carboxyl carrier protein
MAGDGRIEVTADMVASVVALSAGVGAHVEAGDTLLVVESVKMEIPVPAPSSGVVSAVHVGCGDVVEEGDLLVALDGRRAGAP